MDLNQVVSLTGHLSWGLSMPSTISFGDTALLTIKGDAFPFTWAIVGAAAYTEEYSLKHSHTKKQLNVLKSELGAVNLPIIEVIDARGNRITQNIIEIPLPPTADLTGDTSIDVGSSGSFDASGSTPGVGASIKKYEWDWQYDGLSFTPSGDTGSTQTHTYAWSGNYTVAVRVRDNYDRTDIATLSVTVNGITPLLDTFTDGDGTSIADHTSDSGHTYTIISGTPIITSNQQTGNGSYKTDSLFGGLTDGVLTFDLTSTGSSLFHAYLRYVDASNNYDFQMSNNGNAIFTRRSSSGNLTLFSGYVGNLVNNVPQPFILTVSGGTFSLNKNGTDYGPWTDPSPFTGGSQIAFSLFSNILDNVTWTPV